MTRWQARWHCHGSLWCCQYTDKPMCNSWADPHIIARWRWRRRAKKYG